MRAPDNPFKTRPNRILLYSIILHGTGIAGPQRRIVGGPILRSFTFSIQPDATFKKRSLDERLSSLFFAPKIMTARALRVPTLRKSHLSDKRSAVEADHAVRKRGVAEMLSSQPTLARKNAGGASRGLGKRYTTSLKAIEPAPALTETRSTAKFDQEDQNRTSRESREVSSYKGHLISTEQLPNGEWVATIVRVDHVPVVRKGVSQFSLTTSPYLARILAIADAEIEIDEIVARYP
jgi:hypothetical protein